MGKSVFAMVALLLVAFFCEAQELRLRKGQVIKRSVRVKKGTYKLDAYRSPDSSVLIIEGNNITIDFNQAVLQGSSATRRPDEFYGVAIMVRGGRNITIRNLRARGYKVALLARGVTGLKLENCDFSYNYRQYLNSTQEKEDISDWMSFHRNEKDQWLRYGAAIYLSGCNEAVVRDCKVTGGQNGLMLVESNGGLIYNNDFSFNSGIGVGLYRSSGNRLLYNRVIFNVRGYSHGVYRRGQDSAGFLVYEQSSNNLFYKNAATHSGDGFFLWAGQSTMDSGQGGCNDNMLLENDFSYAPANGIEVTFSRNIITRNRIFECDHGIWGGYSYNTRINDNQFRNNRIAIAIEHGQEIDIHHNLFYQDREAIRLWAREQQPAGWGYARFRDTRSRGYNIVSNSFNNHPVVLHLSRTDSINVFENRVSGSEVIYRTDATVTRLDTTINDPLLIRLSQDTAVNIPEVKKPNNPFKGIGKLAGRKNIRMTEWGPYDFRYPLLWHANPADTSGFMEFEVLGPKGKWKIVSVKGVQALSRRADSLPSRFTAQKLDAPGTDIEIVAEYTGEAFTDGFGNRVAAEKPFRFSFKKFFQPVDFMVRWYVLDSLNHPVRKGRVEDELLSAVPVKTDTVRKLDYVWWSGLKADSLTVERFITVAEGRAMIPQGTYELSITWDDAVRVYVDGKLLVDEWNPAMKSYAEASNRKVRLKLGGAHPFKVEHVELGGFGTISLKLSRLAEAKEASVRANRPLRKPSTKGAGEK